LLMVTDKNYLSHTTTISRIETGETRIKLEALVLIAQVLQADLSALLFDLPNLLIEKEEEKEEELREAITHHVNLMNYEKVEQLAPLLVSEKSKQLKYWCEALVARCLYQNPLLAHQKLLAALKLTLPAAFHKKTGIFLPDKLDGFELTTLECYIWMELANVQPLEERQFSYERLYSKLQHSKILGASERVRMLAAVCYHLSLHLLKSGSADSCILDWCHKGISIEINSQHYNYLGFFYYNIGRYYFAQNQLTNAKKFFQRSYDFFNSTQDFDKAEKTFNMVKTQYNITLCKDLWD